MRRAAGQVLRGIVRHLDGRGGAHGCTAHQTVPLLGNASGAAFSCRPLSAAAVTNADAAGTIPRAGAARQAGGSR